MQQPTQKHSSRLQGVEKTTESVLLLFVVVPLR